MFLILSGVILAAGVLYWFWSHIQLTQKKVQLLENAVFELRGMLAPSELQESEPVPVNQEQGQVPQYRDLDDDDWADQGQNQETQDVRLAVIESVPQEAPLTQTQVVREEPVKMTPELIQGFNMYTEEVKTVETKAVKPEEPQTLEGMTIKDLRRMASERGITGTSEMKKKELVAALRESVTTPAPVEVEAEVTELTLEAF